MRAGAAFGRWRWRVGRLTVPTLERACRPNPVPGAGDAHRADLRMRVSAEPASIPRVRAAVDRALVDRGWPDEGPHDVALAVTEALCNAIEHGSPPGGPVDVEMTVTPERARVRVVDAGRPGTTPPSGEPTTPPAGSLRGRGRVIMRELADRVDVRSAGQGTAVLLDFRRAP